MLPRSGPLLKAHRNYLKRRAFDPNELQRLWGISGIKWGMGVKMGLALSWRILIPIYYRSEVVSWTTRAISKEAKLRYISADPEEESIPHKQLLFGEQYARHSVIVHEGPFDVFTTGPGAVGTLGTSFTSAQIRRIAKYPRRAICFDSSPSAQRRADELCDLLDVFPGDTYKVELETGSDPNECDPDEIEELRRKFLK